jgi:Cdc6-like AAA superfamily ATPase
LTNPLDDLAAIQRSKGERVESTCEWLLVQGEYIAWLVRDGPQLLRLVGAPGMGKTMISSFLVDELERKAQQNPAMILAYYFCDNKDEKRNTATAILRGLLLQLLRQRPILFKHIQPDYNLMKKSLFENLDALWRILLNMLKDSDVGDAYILVDALDECQRSSREALLKLLAKQFIGPRLGGSLKVKFLITCRPEPEIELTLRAVGENVRVDSRKINADLSNFIEAKVNELSKDKGYPKKLAQDIKKALRDYAGGTFLWAALVLDDIFKTTMPSKIRRKLQALPSSLAEVYSRILSNIDEDCTEDARFILQCVVVARRPLTVRELAMARALGSEEWNENTIPPDDFLDELKDDFKCCEPLLFLNDDETVNLVHQSAKDYLLSEYLQANEKLSRYCVVKDKANLLIFQICWRYLGMEEFDQGRKIIDCYEQKYLYPAKLPEEYLNSYKFLEYAAEEWQEHVLAASPALVTDYEFKKDNLDKMPTLRDTWLFRAVAEGQEVVVRLLLENGADVESKHGSYRQTPLWMAAAKGHEAVVKLLTSIT